MLNTDFKTNAYGLIVQCTMWTKVDPSIDRCSPNHWMFHQWNGSWTPLSSLFILYCYYLFMYGLQVPASHLLFLSIILSKSVRRLFRCLLLSLSTTLGLSWIQCGLISVLLSVTLFDIQGIPGLMHCKFFSIMNCVGRIKAMDMEHTLQRNARDPEVVKALTNLNEQSWGT